MKTVYFISGLGADRRAFNFLQLSFCHPIFIDWPPHSTSDTLPSYAEKIFDIINDEHAIVVGLSFGGMLATEIAKKHPQTRVILISSCKTYKEIPGYLRMWRYLPLYKLYRHRLKKIASMLPSKILGVEGVEQKKIQMQILRDSNPPFTRWAIGAILHWRNTIIPSNVFHIHGTKDNLLPYKYVTADYTVQGGAHIMVMDKAAELSEILKQRIMLPDFP